MHLHTDATDCILYTQPQPLPTLCCSSPAPYAAVTPPGTNILYTHTSLHCLQLCSQLTKNNTHKDSNKCAAKPNAHLQTKAHIHTMPHMVWACPLHVNHAPLPWPLP